MARFSSGDEGAVDISQVGSGTCMVLVVGNCGMVTSYSLGIYAASTSSVSAYVLLIIGSFLVPAPCKIQIKFNNTSDFGWISIQI